MSKFTKTLIAPTALATLATLAVMTPFSASAGEVAVSAPMQGATLQENGLDMSIYFTEVDADGYEVVATYVASDAPANPNRIKMRLADGDNVRFSVPGHLDTLYSFERNQTTVSVKAEPVPNHVTMVN